MATQAVEASDIASLPSSIVSRIVEFQKIIPFVIGSVAIGVCSVNRTLIKSLMHITIATLIALVFNYFFHYGVTAFLLSSFAYVLACSLAQNGNVDTSFKIIMPIGFSILWFIDMYVTKITSILPNNEFPYLPYFATVILSGLCGLAGFYIVQSFPNKNAFLYDLKGCSCDNCANANTCSAGSKNKVLMGRILNK